MIAIGVIIVLTLLFIVSIWPFLLAVGCFVIATCEWDKTYDMKTGGALYGPHTPPRVYTPGDVPIKGLSADELTNCVRLHQQMAVLCPEYTVRTFEMNDLSTLLPECDRWIVRADWDRMASNTIIVSSTDELRAAYNTLHTRKKHRIMMSEWRDRMTIEGHAFVLRADIWIDIVNKSTDGVVYPQKTATMLSPQIVYTDGSDAASDPPADLADKMKACLTTAFTALLPLVNIRGKDSIARDEFTVDVAFEADGRPFILSIYHGHNTETADVGPQTEIVDILDTVVDPLTYLYVGDKLEDAAIAKYLVGWRRSTQMHGTDYVDLIIGAGSEMASTWLNHVPTHMKHRLQIKNITDKVRLHDNLMKLAPRTIAETYHVSDESVITDGTPWIVRTGYGFNGLTAGIATTTDELQRLRREFIARNIKKNQTQEQREYDVIMSKYMQNPLLLNGRKIEIRVLLIAVVHSVEAIRKSSLPQKAVYMFRKYKLTTSLKPFNLDDFSDMEIHTSHSNVDQGRYFTLDNFPLIAHETPSDDVEKFSASTAEQRIQKLLQTAFDKLIDDVNVFPESTAGYELMGADIIFDDTGKPIIVEINAIPGMSWLKIFKDGDTDYRPAYLDFLFHSIGGEFGIDIESQHVFELVRRSGNKSGGFHNSRHNNKHNRNRHDNRHDKYDNPVHIPADPAVLATVEFPYHTLFKTESDVDRAFEAIRDYRLKIVPAEYTIANMPELTPADKQFRGKSVLCEMRPSDYHVMNWVSDWFNEPRRVRCKRYDEPQTQLEYYAEHRAELTSQELSYEQIHDAVYEAVRGCNNFRPGLLRGIVRAVGAQSVLDISAGWGDRLIGAIAAGVRYVGVDPNPGVHEGYQQIIKRFTAGDDAQADVSSKYTLIQSPFETAELPDETFDLVMTSPPYFKLEIYTDAPGQSTATHSTEDAWFDGFLMTSIKKAWSRINPGGYLVMVINNTRGEPDYVLRMRDAVSLLDSAEYQGCLPYAQTAGKVVPGTTPRYKSPQPMWIWQKRATITIAPLATEHTTRIVEITHDPGFKYVANGRPWTPERVSQLIEYADEESTSPQYAHYVVKYGEIVVGYIGWYPLGDTRDSDHDSDQNSIQLRVFIAEFEQGRGYGLAAVRAVLVEAKRRYPAATVYMQMVAENIGSLKLAERAGFTQVPGEFPAGSTMVLRWKYSEK